jgi:hypothetical protein
MESSLQWIEFIARAVEILAIANNMFRQVVFSI